MLLDLTSQEKISYGSKKHAFSDDKVTDAIKFLTDYKFRDKDVLWTSHIEDYWSNKIETYHFKMDFSQQHFAQELGFTNASTKQKLSGDLEIRVTSTEYYDGYDVELNTPSIRILSNYEQFFNTVVWARYENSTVPMWGSKDMFFAVQRISKRFKSVKGLAKGVDDLLNVAYELIQEGLDWSNSEQVKTQLEYEYSEKSKIFKLREEQQKLQVKIDEIQTKFDSYRGKCMDSFKQVRNALKDFVQKNLQEHILPKSIIFNNFQLNNFRKELNYGKYKKE